MKLIATEDKNGARSLTIEYGDRLPDKESAKLVEAAHQWIWEPFERRNRRQLTVYPDPTYPRNECLLREKPRDTPLKQFTEQVFGDDVE